MDHYSTYELAAVKKRARGQWLEIISQLVSPLPLDGRGELR